MCGGGGGVGGGGNNATWGMGLNFLVESILARTQEESMLVLENCKIETLWS